MTAVGPWQRVTSRTAYENPWIRVREDEVVRPDGTPGTYGVVEVPDAVFVVAVTAAEEIYLTRLFRYTTEQDSIELPAGGAEGQDPLEAARRELREETGLEAERWTEVGGFFSLNGVCRHRAHVFVARDLDESGRRPEAAEGITAVWPVPVAEVLALIRRGEITDSDTVAAFTIAAAHEGWLVAR